jgi:N-glycosylase/DNA lyase
MTSFSVDTRTLGNDFIEKLKSLFPNQKVEIQVIESDATDYITSSEENKRRLDKALERIEKMDGLIEVKPDQLKF